MPLHPSIFMILLPIIKFKVTNASLGKLSILFDPPVYQTFNTTTHQARECIFMIPSHSST